MITTMKANSIEEIEIFLETEKSQSTSQIKWIFRGCYLKEWMLQTSLARHWKDNICPTKHTAIVQDYLTGLLKDIDIPNNLHIDRDKPILGHGQHHKLWTNLLDWTTNIKMAHQFASVSGTNKKNEGVFIYVLGVFEEMVDKKQKDGKHGNLVSVFDPANRLEWNKEKTNYTDLLTINKNIDKQEGLFTYCSLLKGFTIENYIYTRCDIWDYDQKIPLYKFEIPCLQVTDSALEDTLYTHISSDLDAFTRDINKKFNLTD
ncbi:hypothetical protein DID80_05790 [Candidatus Marinamargulisbacteria bacterium SCGC AAA071-K20]|nr:hypothetical protein DID80_05790 [Candidatus Marinamargulisbacteria bacterium SCGC AAA071-K20]